MRKVQTKIRKYRFDLNNQELDKIKDICDALALLGVAVESFQVKY